jgi:hypothetical protein
MDRGKWDIRGEVRKQTDVPLQTHANVENDQERVHMRFAVMEAIHVIRPKNAPMTTKTTTR